jgi:hypothetical protein
VRVKVEIEIEITVRVEVRVTDEKHHITSLDLHFI